jgi:hypothetical protein
VIVKATGHINLENKIYLSIHYHIGDRFSPNLKKIQLKDSLNSDFRHEQYTTFDTIKVKRVFNHKSETTLSIEINVHLVFDSLTSHNLCTKSCEISGQTLVQTEVVRWSNFLSINGITSFKKWLSLPLDGLLSNNWCVSWLSIRFAKECTAWTNFTQAKFDRVDQSIQCSCQLYCWLQ